MVLFDLENAEDVKDLTKSLIFAGKQVAAYSFDPSKKGICPVLPDHFQVLNKKQLHISGFPLPKEMDRYKSFQPDTIMDLTIHPHPVLQYLSLKSEADFRVGFHQDEISFGDLLIEYNPEQGFVFLVSQLHFYMKSLRTK